LRRVLLAALPLLLVGCGKGDKQPSSPPLIVHTAHPGEVVLPKNGPYGTDSPALGFDGRGLVIGTVPRNLTIIPFGAPEGQVEAAVSQIFDGKVQPIRSHNDECGAGPMDFVQFLGLSLNFHDGKFVGIFDEKAPGTATLGQLAVGIRRSEAEGRAHIEMVPDSTLGAEFTYRDSRGVAGGFFDGEGPDAKISGLYAGANCFFR
jgi:hypothetical protein